MRYKGRMRAATSLALRMLPCALLLWSGSSVAIESAAAVKAAALKADQTPPVRFRLDGDPATLDWNLAQSSFETHVIMNLMEGLTEEGADLKPNPALASHWDVSPDGLTYKFYLKPGVYWSDGRALKASDFVDSWLRLLNPRTHAGYANYLFDIENAEGYHTGKVKDAYKVGVKALNDSELVVKLRHRVPYFLHIPSFWVTFPIRSDLLFKYGKDWATPGKIATLGPYLLGEWIKGKSLRLDRNPTYSSILPVAKAEAVIEPDEKKARMLFEGGKLDFMQNATTEDLLKTRSPQSGVRVVQFPYLATYYLGFNTRHGVTKDPELRKALGAAIDRYALPSVLQGGQLVATSFVPPGLDGYNPPVYQPMSLYDARGALTRAGFAEGRGFPKLSLWVEKMDSAQELASFIVKSLRDKLGVAAEAHIGSPAEFEKAMSSGKVDLFVRHWGADYPEPSNYLEVFTTESGSNLTGWKSGEFDQILERARAAGDPKSRVDSYLQAEFLLVEKDNVITPLFYRRNTVLLGPRIKDFSISPLNYLFLKNVSVK
jgi:oligopeptide transport system substrate-binding protein